MVFTLARNFFQLESDESDELEVVDEAFSTNFMHRSSDQNDSNTFNTSMRCNVSGWLAFLRRISRLYLQKIVIF